MTRLGGIHRYVLEAELGSGAMGTVYRARDRERDVRLALKLLRYLEPDAIYRFKQEFRALADVSHPNLVSLYELIAADRDTWILTMELIDGADFLDHVRGPDADEIPAFGEPSSQAPGQAPASPAGSQVTTAVADLDGIQAALLAARGATPMPVPMARAAPLWHDDQIARLRAALRQLAEAVAALHHAGVLHRDLKPSNVLVTGEGRVVVLDFGIVLPLQGAENARESRLHLAGTPPYMAPEQGTGVPLTAASDWYSVGIMLYEALTGRIPYSGELDDMLHQKRCFDPPPPMLYGDAVPADLDALCMDLLARAPDRRPSGDEVLARLGGARTSAPTLATARSSAELLVGRARQLAVLENTFAHSARGQLGAVLIRGRSGVGKTTLVQRFVADVENAGAAMVLSGRCHEREQVPFKALDSLMDALTRQLLDKPASAVASLLPPRIEVLARMFPVLRQIEVVARADAARARGGEASSPRERRRLAVEVLRALFTRLTIRRPLVLTVDDVQWGDTDSAGLLADALVPAADLPVLLIFVCRTDTGDMGEFLDALSTVRLTRRTTGRGRQPGSMVVGWPGRWIDLPLDQLATADARSLAAMLLGRAGLGAGHADVIARESGGNPLFVHELVRYLREHESARRDGTLAVTLEQVLRQRLAELPAPARALLDVVAVASRPLDEDMAFRAAGLAWEDQSALAYLRSAYLVRTYRVNGRDRIEAFHDRIRELVLAELDGQAAPAGDQLAPLAACHRKLAECLEAAGEADAEVLAWHHECAGARDRAAMYTRRAAERAARALAMDRAAALFERVLRLGAWSGTERRQLHIHHGEALLHAGRGAEAAAAYLRAAEGADTDEALKLRGRAAEHLLRSGHIDDGLDILRQVLAALGLRLPKSRAGMLGQLLHWRLRTRLRGFEYQARAPGDIPPAVRTRLELCWSATASLAMVDLQAAMVFQQRHAMDALAAGDSGHVARAMTAEAGFLAVAGPQQRQRALDLVEGARDLAQGCGDHVALAWSHGVTALVHFMSGDWRACCEAADQALPLLTDRDAMRWERSSAELYRIWGLVRLGALGRVAERTLALRLDAEERGDLYAMTLFSIGWPNITWLLAGDVEGARAIAAECMERWSRRGYQLEHYWHLIAAVHADLYAGDSAGALARIDRERAQVQRTLVLRTQIARVDFLDLEGRSALHAAMTSHGDARQEHLARAERCRRRLAREVPATARASAALLAAGMAAVRADSPGDERVLEQMRAAAQACDVASEPLRAALIRGYLGQRVGGDAGANLVRAAARMLADEGAIEPERMSALLVPGL